MTDENSVERKIFLRPIFIIVIVLTFLVWAAFLASYFIGATSDWYKSLIQPDINEWVVRIAWVVAVILAYVGVYFLWKDSTLCQINQDIEINIYILIGAVIISLWSAVLFYERNIAAAVWISLFLMLYQFWVVMHVWSHNFVSGILFIPLFLMYAFLAYFMINLASKNNIPL